MGLPNMGDQVWLMTSRHTEPALQQHCQMFTIQLQPCADGAAAVHEGKVHSVSCILAGAPRQQLQCSAAALNLLQMTGWMGPAIQTQPAQRKGRLQQQLQCSEAGSHLVNVGVVDPVDEAYGGRLVGVSLRQLHMYLPVAALIGTCTGLAQSQHLAAA